MAKHVRRAALRWVSFCDMSRPRFPEPVDKLGAVLCGLYKPGLRSCSIRATLALRGRDKDVRWGIAAAISIASTQPASQKAR